MIITVWPKVEVKKKSRAIKTPAFTTRLLRRKGEYITKFFEVIGL